MPCTDIFFKLPPKVLTVNEVVMLYSLDSIMYGLIIHLQTLVFTKQ